MLPNQLKFNVYDRRLGELVVNKYTLLLCVRNFIHSRILVPRITAIHPGNKHHSFTLLEVWQQSVYKVQKVHLIRFANGDYVIPRRSAIFFRGIIFYLYLELFSLHTKASNTKKTAQKESNVMSDHCCPLFESVAHNCFSASISQCDFDRPLKEITCKWKGKYLFTQPTDETADSTDFLNTVSSKHTKMVL